MEHAVGPDGCRSSTRTIAEAEKTHEQGVEAGPGPVPWARWPSRCGNRLWSAAAFAREYFPLPRRELRIASAYFSIESYELGWKHIPPGIQLHISVGVGDWANEQVKRTVEAEVKRELRW